MSDPGQQHDHDSLAVTVSVELDAGPERVWAALVTTGGLEPWMGTGATLDPRPGGALHFPDPAGGRERNGKVTALSPGERLDYVWWTTDRPTERSSVSITVSSTGGGTTLTVVESPLNRPSVGFATAKTVDVDATSARSRSLIGTWCWRLAMVTVASQMIRV